MQHKGSSCQIHLKINFGLQGTTLSSITTYSSVYLLKNVIEINDIEIASCQPNSTPKTISHTTPKAGQGGVRWNFRRLV